MQHLSRREKSPKGITASENERTGVNMRGGERRKIHKIVFIAIKKILCVCRKLF